MPINNKQNLAPVLAAQEQNITGGQLTVRDAILQAVSDFEAQTGLTLADVLADTLALKNGHAVLTDDTGQLRADTVQLLANLVEVKADTGLLAQLPDLIADVERLKQGEEFYTIEPVDKSVILNSTNVPLGTNEVVNYDGRGVVWYVQSRQDVTSEIWADGQKITSWENNSGTNPVILVGTENVAAPREIKFRENLTIITTPRTTNCYFRVYGALFA